jgi:hypothetical protein
VINDLYLPWEGKVVLRLTQNGKTVLEKSQPGVVTALG